MARRPSISGRYPVEGEDTIGQSMFVPDRHSSADRAAGMTQELPHTELPDRCRPSLAACGRSVMCADASHAAPKIPIFRAKNRPWNCAFETAQNRPPGALKNHQKILFIQ